LSDQAVSRIRKHYRCLGIGVGPSNLSLASLMYRYPDLSNLFLDRKPSFGWHDGQQMPGSSLQVSALKDLVTLTDPTNDFSFLSYLHSQGRIYHFINAQFQSVPRQEFRNYMLWASSGNCNIVFGEEVQSVGFDGVFVVRTSQRMVTADNVVVGVGNQPWVPSFVTDWVGDTQFHVCEFMSKAQDLGGKRVGVVGGGQSGAEAFLDLISRPAGELPSRVVWISKRPNYFPIDDSPFTNDYYTPQFSDHFFQLELAAREAFTSRQVLTSDGISLTTLQDIYQRSYVRCFVEGARDLIGFYPNREVVRVGKSGGVWALSFVSNDQRAVEEHVELDAIVWATGFRPARMEFLAPIQHRLEREGREYKIDRDFAVVWDGPRNSNLFVQNAARVQRGLADPNLSLIAWRSQRILDRLLGKRREEPRSSFIEWSAAPTDRGRRDR
jgi:lysine N6-hydroxylase